MKKVTEIITAYLADDGTRFLTQQDCEKYEKELSNATFWRLICAPDLTEGRGHYEMWILKVKADKHLPIKALVEDWCYRVYGRPVAFVMGVAPIISWFVTQVDRDAWNDAGKDRPNDYVSVGDYKYRPYQHELTYVRGENNSGLSNDRGWDWPPEKPSGK